MFKLFQLIVETRHKFNIALWALALIASSCGISSAGAKASPLAAGTAIVPPLPQYHVKTVQSSLVKGPVILKANGLGNADFGQAQAIAVSNLENILGPPAKTTPTPSNNCTIDGYIRFRGITAFFDHARFAGYSTGSLLVKNANILNSRTTKGLKVGDTLKQAHKIYGSDFRTSYAKGGSWFAFTTHGTFTGLLTQEVNSSNPPATIALISAGVVGCPDSTP